VAAVDDDEGQNASDGNKRDDRAPPPSSPTACALPRLLDQSFEWVGLWRDVNLAWARRGRETHVAPPREKLVLIAS